VGVSVQNASSSGAATLGSPAAIAVPAYTVQAPITIPQLGAAVKNIDGGDARISAFVYRIGDVLYATHSTEVNNRTAVQWFKINALTRNVIDTGMIADPALDLFYPAIAANTNGTVALAFNGSSATNYVSSYAVLGEPIGGKLSFGSLVLLKAGVATYHPSATAQNPSRWGDYSALTPDPANPTHFWALTIYPSSSAAWSMQITEIIAAPLSLAIAHSGTNVLLSWPGAATGYQPQSTPSLNSPTWTGLPQSVTLANNQFSVTVPAANHAQFFRLAK